MALNCIFNLCIFSHLLPPQHALTNDNNIRIVRKVYVWLLTVFCANYWQPCGRVTDWRARNTCSRPLGAEEENVCIDCKTLCLSKAKTTIGNHLCSSLPRGAFDYTQVSTKFKSTGTRRKQLEFRLDHRRGQINFLSMVCSSFNLKSASCGVNCRVSVSVHLLL